MNKTNHPKLVLSFSPDTLEEKKMPMKIPTTDIAVNFIKRFQSIAECSLLRNPIKPMAELIAIINSDVPTADFIGNFAKKTRAGIIRKPPPAPTNPVMAPTNDPIKIIII